MKLLAAIGVLLFVSVPAHAQAQAQAQAPAQTAKPCEELKDEITKKLDAKGVKGYTLEIVAKDVDRYAVASKKDAEGKVVGTVAKDKDAEGKVVGTIAKDKDAEGKVVGTCDGGTKKILYNRTSVPAETPAKGPSKP